MPSTQVRVDPFNGAVYPAISQNTVFGVNQTHAISWTNTVSSLTELITSLDIWLGTGSGTQVKSLYSVIKVPFPATSCFTWTPAPNLADSNLYTFVFRGLDKESQIKTMDYVTWFRLADATDALTQKASTCEADANPTTDVIITLPQSRSAASTTTDSPFVSATDASFTSVDSVGKANDILIVRTTSQQPDAPSHVNSNKNESPSPHSFSILLLGIFTSSFLL
ncbi:UNVERIFIED_CONTAM: hypothetical protein HDU68_007981 [Siphonaria sp. JEL0065]|nr:hypothetical protein HDU68_007981 [Siphonaria sp. JEL0065]